MLYLAQVQKKGFLGKTELRLLAQQESEHTWTVLSADELVLTSETVVVNEGVLVLVDLSSDRQVLRVDDAKDWVLEVLQTFLTNGVTPSFLKEESDRAEQWRQELTLQSQEIGRKALEVEARREQIQILEDTLKRQKKYLEDVAAQFNIQLEFPALDLDEEDDR
ncbi:hypothetical protein [Geitlerinema sp. PCC 7407]|uniref:hypothetical protein n=1 Tax=Geitlerinema sp. PCC 7407 TaxID=1173025 RepID=UPI00029F96F0|nr:hypothetical protein [Geitlerinema sp. PCC 7407]AFY65873.1 hypothetical protein GEI7407_1379 [Geitlerinema sp. PCC 7407]